MTLSLALCVIFPISRDLIPLTFALDFALVEATAALAAVELSRQLG